jgi:hypothetical protein
VGEYEVRVGAVLLEDRVDGRHVGKCGDVVTGAGRKLEEDLGGSSPLAVKAGRSERPLSNIFGGGPACDWAIA